MDSQLLLPAPHISNSPSAFLQQRICAAGRLRVKRVHAPDTPPTPHVARSPSWSVCLFPAQPLRQSLSLSPACSVYRHACRSVAQSIRMHVGRPPKHSVSLSPARSVSRHMHVGLLLSRLVCISLGRSVDRHACRSVAQSVCSQSVCLLPARPVSRCACRLVGQSIGMHVARSLSQSVGVHVARPRKHSVSLSPARSQSVGTHVARSLRQSACTSLSRSGSWPACRSVAQEFGGPVARSLSPSECMSLGRSVSRHACRSVAQRDRIKLWLLVPCQGLLAAGKALAVAGKAGTKREGGQDSWSPSGTAGCEEGRCPADSLKVWQMLAGLLVPGRDCWSWKGRRWHGRLVGLLVSRRDFADCWSQGRLSPAGGAGTAKQKAGGQCPAGTESQERLAPEWGACRAAGGPLVRIGQVRAESVVRGLSETMSFLISEISEVLGWRCDKYSLHSRPLVAAGLDLRILEGTAV